MRTLPLLTALLLLVFQARAETVGKTDDQVPVQDQPGAKVPDLTISFDGDARSTREASVFSKRNPKSACRLRCTSTCRRICSCF